MKKSKQTKTSDTKNEREFCMAITILKIKYFCAVYFATMCISGRRIRNSRLHSEFKANMGYKNICLKNKTNKRFLWSPLPLFQGAEMSALPAAHFTTLPWSALPCPYLLNPNSVAAALLLKAMVHHIPQITLSHTCS